MFSTGRSLKYSLRLEKHTGTEKFLIFWGVMFIALFANNEKLHHSESERYTIFFYNPRRGKYFILISLVLKCSGSGFQSFVSSPKAYCSELHAMSYAKAAIKVMQYSISFVHLKQIPRNKGLTVIQQTFNRIAFNILISRNFQNNQENLSRNLPIHSPRFSQEPKH